MDKILPIHVEVANIKKILYAAISVCLIYGSWITLYVFATHERVSNVSLNCENRAKTITSDIEDIKKKSYDNKNQITYLKGSKQNKPKG